MEPTLLTREYKKRGVTTKSLYFRTLAMPCLNYFWLYSSRLRAGRIKEAKNYFIKMV